MRPFAWPIAVLIAACSVNNAAMHRDADADATTDASRSSIPPGRVEIDGAIETAPFRAREAMFGVSNFYAAPFTTIQGPHFEVAISDHHQPCGQPRERGQVLLIDLFQDPSAMDSRVTAPNDFRVWSLSEIALAANDPPTDNRCVASWSAVNDFGGQGRIALDGRVVITAASSEELSGTIDLTFSGGRLQGSFTAPFCDDWLLSASVPRAPSSQTTP